MTMDICTVQAAAWQNKIDKGFNTTDVPREFRYLIREIDEAITAWLNDLPDLDLELADILLFLVALAQMLGVDLQDAVQRKLAINVARTYIRGPGGDLVRVPVNEPKSRKATPSMSDDLSTVIVQIVGRANGNPSLFDGQWLVEYDPSRPGTGPHGQTTLAHFVCSPDRAQARRFTDVAEAHAYWAAASGRPGAAARPATAFTIAIERAEDDHDHRG